MTGTIGPPSLTWRVVEVEPENLAAVPTLQLRLEIGCPGGEPVQCVALTVSVRIAVALRDYDATTRERLRGVFGTAEQWPDSLRDLVWARPTVMVPRFTNRTTVDVPVPCGQDMDLASISYLHAVADGDIPLRLLFNGTIFHDSGGWLRTAQIPWNNEALFRIPAETWHQVRDRYFGQYRWLRVGKEVAQRLHEYQGGGAFPSLDAAIDALLAGQGGRIGPSARSTS